MNPAEVVEALRAQNYFVVERVVDKRYSKGKAFYQLKWLGYSEKFNTWEPVEALEFIADLILEYENANKEGIEVGLENDGGNEAADLQVVHHESRPTACFFSRFSAIEVVGHSLVHQERPGPKAVIFTVKFAKNGAETDVVLMKISNVLAKKKFKGLLLEYLERIVSLPKEG